MFLAIDRVSKFAHVASHDADTELSGAAFLRGVVQAFPCAIRTVPTDDGMALAGLPRYRDGPTARRTGHIFDRVCRERGIEHELTRPYRPWANGRAERTNRTAKEAAVKALHHPDPEALRGPRPGLRHRPRLRQAPQGAALAHTLPGRLRRLEGRPFSLRDRPAPPHPGTAHPLARPAGRVRAVAAGRATPRPLVGRRRAGGAVRAAARHGVARAGGGVGGRHAGPGAPEGRRRQGKPARTRSAARGAASRPRPVPCATPRAGRSPSRSCRARRPSRASPRRSWRRRPGPAQSHASCATAATRPRPLARRGPRARRRAGRSRALDPQGRAAARPSRLPPPGRGHVGWAQGVARGRHPLREHRRQPPRRPPPRRRLPPDAVP
jgi:hypothetical protein